MDLDDKNLEDAASKDRYVMMTENHAVQINSICTPMRMNCNVFHVRYFEPQILFVSSLFHNCDSCFI